MNPAGFHFPKRVKAFCRGGTNPCIEVFPQSYLAKRHLLNSKNSILPALKPTEHVVDLQPHPDFFCLDSSLANPASICSDWRQKPG